VLVMSVTVVSGQDNDSVVIPAQKTVSALVTIFGAWGVVVFVVGGFVGRQWSQFSDHQRRKEMLGVEIESEEKSALAHQMRAISDTIGMAMKHVSDSTEYSQKLTDDIIALTEENVKLKLENQRLADDIEGIDEIRKKNEKLMSQNVLLEKEKESLTLENNSQSSTIEQLRQQLEQREAELKECIKSMKEKLEKLKEQKPEPEEESSEDTGES